MMSHKYHINKRINYWTMIMFYKQLNASQATWINNVHNKLAEEVWHVNTSHDWLSHHMTVCVAMVTGSLFHVQSWLQPAGFWGSVFGRIPGEMCQLKTRHGAAQLSSHAKSGQTGWSTRGKGHTVTIRHKVWLIRERIYSGTSCQKHKVMRI